MTGLSQLDRVLISIHSSSRPAFRDALLSHLNSLPPRPTSDAIISRLVLAGSQLELLKYAEQFYELIILGGLLQPGGSYLDNERCRFSVWACGRSGGLGWADGEGEGDWKVQVKELVDVLKKVIQRWVKAIFRSIEVSSHDADRVTAGTLGTNTFKSHLRRTLCQVFFNSMYHSHHPFVRAIFLLDHLNHFQPT